MKYIAALAVILSAGLFIMTSPPTIYIGDGGQIAASAYTLGICYPPGYPLFTLILKIFSFLPLGDIAFRMNMAAVLFAVMGILIFYAAGAYALKKMTGAGPGLPAGIIALALTCAYAFSGLSWFESVQIKGGIYGMESLFVMACFYFLLKFYFEKDSRYFYLGMYAAGFLPAIHYTGVLAGIFTVAGLVMSARGKKPGFFALGAAAFALSFFTSNLYLFIRAGTAGVRWADIGTFRDVLLHIIRYASFSLEPVPFNANEGLFKLGNYFIGAAVDLNIIALFALLGAWRLFCKERKAFYILAAFFALNLCAVIYITPNGPGRMNLYINRAYYTVINMEILLFSFFGAYRAVSLIKSERMRRISSYAVFLIPAPCSSF